MDYETDEGTWWDYRQAVETLKPSRQRKEQEGHILVGTDLNSEYKSVLIEAIRKNPEMCEDLKQLKVKYLKTV